MEDLGQWYTWVNNGALGAFAVFVCFMFYRLATAGGRKALEIGERYVASTEQLHETLEKAEAKRAELCSSHAAGLHEMAEGMAESNACLMRLVELHEEGDVHQAVVKIDQASDEMQRMKQVVRQACHMCRAISAREFPNSAAEVATHCDEIERVIGQA
jgi:septation ring formation regulator EzrA